MKFLYDYNTLSNALANGRETMWGFNTTIKRGYNSVHVFYKSQAIATVTPQGVRTYRSPLVISSASGKKRLNSVLREINWALVTRNGVSFLLYRPTEEVVTFTGHVICYPNGEYADVDTKPITKE